MESLKFGVFVVLRHRDGGVAPAKSGATRYGVLSRPVSASLECVADSVRADRRGRQMIRQS